jgi:hypothetical protein
MKQYKAKELFLVIEKKETSIKNEIRELSFPFNLSFKIIKDKADEFRGPGVYVATYKDEVIYIGSYSSFNMNIIQDRWVKHIQTFTNRGYRLGFNSKTKVRLIPSILKPYFENEPYRFCDTGTVTSIERLTFAAEFFEYFKENSNKILNDFCFHYERIEENQNAKYIESQLITRFSPLCNRKSKKRTITRGLKINTINDFLRF